MVHLLTLASQRTEPLIAGCTKHIQTFPADFLGTFPSHHRSTFLGELGEITRPTPVSSNGRRARQCYGIHLGADRSSICFSRAACL